MEPKTVEDLEQLRQSIVNELTPLIVSSNMGAEEQFTFYLRAAQTTGKSDMYHKAFDAAKNIEDASTKAEALSDLLAGISDELDYAQQESTEEIPAPEVVVTEDDNQE